MKFHKEKLMLHRATMQAHKDRLLARGHIVNYLEFRQDLLHEGVRRINIEDPVDHILESRTLASTEKLGAELKILESPGLSNTHWLDKRFLPGGHWMDEKKAERSSGYCRDIPAEHAIMKAKMAQLEKRLRGDLCL